MKTLQRYLGREILLSTLLFFTALLMLYAFFDLIHELGKLGNADYQLGKILIYVLLNLPGHVYELFPIAALIGTLFALTQLVANSEYTVMRCAGASLGQIAWSLLRVGLVFVVLAFLIGEYLAPHAEQIAQKVRLQATKNVVAQQFRTGFWLKIDQSFVNIRTVLPDNTLLGVRIFEFAEGSHLKSIRAAEVGSFLGQDQWRLKQVSDTQFSDHGITLVNRDESIWSSVLKPSMLSVHQLSPENLQIKVLYDYIQLLSSNGQKTARFEIALWTKILYPVAVIVVMLLALPFAYFQRRSGGMGMRIFAGIMLGLLFHLLNRLFSYVGLLNEWPPLLTAALPTALFCVATLLLLWKLERR